MGLVSGIITGFIGFIIDLVLSDALQEAACGAGGYSCPLAWLVFTIVPAILFLAGFFGLDK